MSGVALGGGPSPLWYTTRAGGLIALVLLSTSVVLGILTSVRLGPAGWPRFLTAGLHRNISLLALAFLLMHILAAVADSFAPVRLIDTIVPFVSAYRALWLGLGATALDLLLVVTVTSLFRQRVGQRLWRTIHWAGYASWPLAVFHGLGSGTDTRLPIALGLDAVCVMAVLAALSWRVVYRWPAHPGVRLAAGLTAVALPVGLGVFTALGPLQPGWARRAGTPPALLAGSTGGPVTPPSGSGGGSGGLPALPFTAPLSGTLAQTPASMPGLVAVHVRALAEHGNDGILDLVITGAPLADGGVSMTTSTASFGPPGQPDLYRGRVSGLNGSYVQLTMSDSAGQSIGLLVNLSVNGAALSGRLTASAGSAVQP